MNEKKQELGQVLVRIGEVERELKRLRDELSGAGEGLKTLGERLRSYPFSVAFGKPDEFLSRTVPTRFIVSEDLKKFLNVEFVKEKLSRVRELEGKLKGLVEKEQELKTHLYKD